MDNRRLSLRDGNAITILYLISRYRKKVLHGKGREDVREISVVFPQKISISDFMGYLKGKSH